MSQQHAQATGRGTQTEPPTCTYGALLARLTQLERWGFEVEVRLLRDRLRAAVHERPLDEVDAEIVAVRDAAAALEHRA